MEKNQQQKYMPAILTGLRIVVGWHFLFEGLSKVANPNWSSAAYLMESKWLFSGFFHWIIAHPKALTIVDQFNTWGLVFIGLGLFLGLFTRIASISGALLLLLYYIANPPFMNSGVPLEGHYFLIDKNLIEAGLLILFASFRKDYLWGIEQSIKQYFQKRKENKFPRNVNHEILESGVGSRR